MPHILAHPSPQMKAGWAITVNCSEINLRFIQAMLFFHYMDNLGVFLTLLNIRDFKFSSNSFISFYLHFL